MSSKANRKKRDRKEMDSSPIRVEAEAVSMPLFTRIQESIRLWIREMTQGWDTFWFAPRCPQVLGVIRVLTGLIVLWTFLVWTFELSTFLGQDGLLPLEYRQRLGATYSWSHLDWCSSSTSLMAVHVIAMGIVAMFAAGIGTRVTSVLTALLVISYGNRSIGAGFGLDQINAFLCLYCAVGNSGGAFSIDRWRGWNQGRADASTNVAIRLIQIHLCVVYFFAAIGKLQGTTWWTGEAVWLSLASYEYQTIDMTWLSGYMGLVAVMTLASLFWELFYAALVWPRLTRPLILILAIPVHLGIGLCMGMMSFALVMLVANLSFIEWSSEKK